jgi:DNA ligase (NAD+)
MVAAKAPAGAGPLAGVTVVFTGGLSTMTREEASEAVAAAGGRVSGSVGARTGLVVVGTDPGSKLAKAKDLGVRTMNEGQFRKLLGR